MKQLLILLLGSIFLCACEPKLSSDEDKIFYSLGVELGKNIRTFSLSVNEAELVAMGVKDAALNKSLKANPADYLGKLTNITSARARVNAEKENKESLAYLKGIESQEGIKKMPSGLLYKEVTPGKGKTPGEKDFVKVHYEGKLRDGGVFDSSVKRGQPANFAVTGVIPCWTEALKLMKVGGKSVIYCPAEIAYGERGSPPVIPGGSALIFELDLLGIENKKH